jgi:hypothetical protein
MRTYNAACMPELIDIIGAGNPDVTCTGPVVIQVKLWDGRAIEAVYGSKPGELLCGDIETTDEVVMDDVLIGKYIDRLMTKGEHFFVVTGSSDTTCSLEWRLAV